MDLPRSSSWRQWLASSDPQWRIHSCWPSLCQVRLPLFCKTRNPAATSTCRQAACLYVMVQLSMGAGQLSRLQDRTDDRSWACSRAGILGLACAMPVPHGADAAALLAQALSGPAAPGWRPHLGSLRSLTDRCTRHRLCLSLLAAPLIVRGLATYNCALAPRHPFVAAGRGARTKLHAWQWAVLRGHR